MNWTLGCSCLVRFLIRIYQEFECTVSETDTGTLSNEWTSCSFKMSDEDFIFLNMVTVVSFPGRLATQMHNISTPNKRKI